MTGIDWILGFAGAVLIGMAGNAAYEGFRRQTGGLRLALFARRRMPHAIRSFDSIAHGMFPLVTWSAARPLRSTTLNTKYLGKSVRTHAFDNSAWREEVAQLRASGVAGRTCYIVALALDHGEHQERRQLELHLAESDYAEALATMRTYHRDSSSTTRLTSALQNGTDTFLAVVPPALLFCTVVVLSRENRLLALRRSRSVVTSPGNGRLA